MSAWGTCTMWEHARGKVGACDLSMVTNAKPAICNELAAVALCDAKA